MNLKIRYNNQDLSEWLIIISIFLSLFFEFVLLVVALFVCWRNNNQLKFSKNLLIFFILMLCYSIIDLFLVNYPFAKFIQQTILLIPFIFGYYIFFRIKKNRLENIFDKYLNVAYIISLLGLIQLIIFFITNKDIFIYFINGSPPIVAPRFIRVRSILIEPGALALLITPALAYYILKSEYKKRFLVILTAFILTFGAASYLIFFSIILYKIWQKNKKYILLAGSLIVIFLIFNPFNTEDNREDLTGFNGVINRFNETYEGFSDMDPHSFELLNLSTYATLTNLWVSLNSPNRISGTGLGTHYLNYSNLYQSNFENYGLSSDDGYALSIRILSEFGVIGLFIFLIFLFIFFNRKSIYNVSTLFILLTLFIRGGHYVLYGVIFWILFYYFTSKKMNPTN